MPLMSMPRIWPGDPLGVVRVRGELHATRLAATADEDLGLDDDRGGAASEHPLGCRPCLRDRVGDLPAGDRQALGDEQGLRVGFLDLHGRTGSCGDRGGEGDGTASRCRPVEMERSLVLGSPWSMSAVTGSRHRRGAEMQQDRVGMRRAMCALAIFVLAACGSAVAPSSPPTPSRVASAAAALPTATATPTPTLPRPPPPFRRRRRSRRPPPSGRWTPRSSARSVSSSMPPATSTSRNAGPRRRSSASIRRAC